MEDKIKLVKKIFPKAFYGSTSDAIYFQFRSNKWYIELYKNKYWIFMRNDDIGVSKDFKDILSFLKVLKRIEG